MTPRQRFSETFLRGSPDRVPYFEEGLRDGVIEAWHKQGLPQDADLAAMFHFDRRERIPVDFELRPELKKWPTNRRGLKAVRRRLDVNDPARFPDDWAARVAEWRDRDHILELSLHPGFFLSMGVNDWKRFLEVMFLLKDAPAFVRDILQMRGEFVARLADRVLCEVEIDFASFSEPIGGNDRPLVSPWDYQNVILKSYAPVLDVLRRHDVKTVVLVTYANARTLLPAAVEAGFNCLWACEAETTDMDYRVIRAEFGRDLRLIGGIDLDAVIAGRDAIREEIMSKVPPLLADGGYIPLADGRVRENVPFENYAHYRSVLEEVTQ